MLKNLAVSAVAFIVLFAVGYSNADVSCISCISTDDPNCAQNPGSLFAKSCQTQNNSCYTRVIDGNTIRGCSDELDQDVLNGCQLPACQLCTSIDNTPGCNNEVFPDTRLSCHVCKQSAQSPNCTEEIKGNPVPCKVYSEEDQCYIHKTAKTFERGCFSESGSKCANRTHCYLCTGNGCNLEKGNSTNIPIAPSSASMLHVSLAGAFIVCLTTLKAFH